MHIEKAIDTILREEQDGFRKGRGCVDQIFSLRNILKQSLEESLRHLFSQLQECMQSICTQYFRSTGLSQREQVSSKSSVDNFLHGLNNCS